MSPLHLVNRVRDACRGLRAPALWGLCGLVLHGPAAARDPFEPPAAASRPAAVRSAEAGAAPAATPEVRHLVQVDGRRYVLDGARRHGVGDLFGEARIACITDAGVVVRDGGALRLLPLFNGVQVRRSAAPAPTTDATGAATGASASTRRPPASPTAPAAPLCPPPHGRTR